MMICWNAVLQLNHPLKLFHHIEGQPTTKKPIVSEVGQSDFDRHSLTAHSNSTAHVVVVVVVVVVVCDRVTTNLCSLNPIRSFWNSSQTRPTNSLVTTRSHSTVCSYHAPRTQHHRFAPRSLSICFDLFRSLTSADHVMVFRSHNFRHFVRWIIPRHPTHTHNPRL